MRIGTTHGSGTGIYISISPGAMTARPCVGCLENVKR